MPEFFYNLFSTNFESISLESRPPLIKIIIVLLLDFFISLSILELKLYLICLKLDFFFVRIYFFMIIKKIIYF